MTSPVKYDMQTMNIMAFFEARTHAALKDCMITDSGKTFFIVTPGSMAKAIGKGGDTIRKLALALRKPVKVAEFSPDPIQFLANLLSPIKPKNIEKNNGTLTITAASSHDRGRMIGRDATHLRTMEQVVRRHFDVKEIKVV